MRARTLTPNSEFFETSLMSSPCGLLCLDDSGRIQWLNKALEQMLELPAERLLGHTEQTLPYSTHLGLFKGSGLMHLVGPGLSRERWLQCTVPEQDAASPVSKFFQDVTELVQLRSENQRLLQQVEELTITDELTGLANQRALNRALNTQVTRSRRYQNPLSLAIIELLDPSTPTVPLSDPAILATSRFLRDRLRWVDLLARWDHNHFVVILPETVAQDGIDLLADISKAFGQVSIPESDSHHPLTLCFGLAQWQKGDDARLLLDRAAEDLNAGHQQDPAMPSS
jgi:diguanylate cyclase (GGDEF)-like protein